MKCPKCGGKSGVTDSRMSKRRRKCFECKIRFSTIEIVIVESIAKKREYAPKKEKPKLEGTWLERINKKLDEIE